MEILEAVLTGAMFTGTSWREALQLARAGSETISLFGSMGAADSVERMDDEAREWKRFSFLKIIKTWERREVLAMKAGHACRHCRHCLLCLYRISKRFQERDAGGTVDQKALNQREKIF